MAASETLITGMNVREFFHDSVATAIGNQQVNATDETVYYLVNLLTLFSRADALYDVVVVLDHNRCPRKRGAGSAIFMHVARPGLLPTEGCIALAPHHLRRLLARLQPGARIHVPA